MDISDLNTAFQKRKNLITYSVGGVIVLGLLYWTFSPRSDEAAKAVADKTQSTISVDDMVTHDKSDKGWVAQSESRVGTLEKSAKDIPLMQQEIQQLKTERDQSVSAKIHDTEDSLKAVKAYQQEIERLQKAASDKSAQPASKSALEQGFGAQSSAASPFQPVKQHASGGYQAPSASITTSPQSDNPATAGLEGGSNDVKIISFSTSPVTATSGSSTPGSTAATDIADTEDSINYLPPNSYASARVIVGVDASVGVQSQTDPLPVLLRIIGPAHSVVQNGKLLATHIEGCTINGAARGDISSEKVYVKLAKMTCDQPGGRIAVSDVKGYVAFAGKAGVRGRVVSREGGLIAQSFLAGIAGGFGKGFGANANRALTGLQIATGTNGVQPQLSTGDIVKGGIGNGVAEAGDKVSQYLIERAEQYQPVIEMPTGIDVEIIFLDGVHVRKDS